VFSKSENTSDLFPILVDHTYRDCLAGVRPKLKLYKSLDQAKAAIDQLQEKLYPQLKASSNTQDPSMTSISEISELDEGVGFSTKIYLPKDFIFDFLLWQATDEDSGSSNDQRERQVAGQEPEPEQSNDWTENETEPPLPPPPPPEKSKEDLEFEHLYEKMTTDSYQERLKEPIKATAKDIPVPMMARLQKKSYEQITGVQTSGSGNNTNPSQISKATATQDTMPGSPGAEPPEGNGKASGGGGGGGGSSVGGGSAVAAVPFVLMVRGNKGGKQQFKSFVAPSDSHLAINLKLQEQKIREEKEKVKRLTLNITERIEEEDYQESLLPPQQRNFTQSYYQKPNKHKFKHQKGAPDADLIFH